MWCAQSCLTLCDPMDYSLPVFSMACFRQEYWSGLPFPPPGDLPNPEIEPASLMSPALAGGFFTTSAIWEAHLEQNRGSNKCLLNNLMSLQQEDTFTRISNYHSYNITLPYCDALDEMYLESSKRKSISQLSVMG